MEVNAPYPSLEGQGEGREAYSVSFLRCSEMVRFPDILITVLNSVYKALDFMRRFIFRDACCMQ